MFSGRLQFVAGGWSMNDEATTHYSSIIDNISFGHRFLNNNFGKCGIPKVAWQIDPFGHSREQASLFALMNFDGLFFGRLDYKDKAKRMINKTMEMIWSGSDDLGSRSNLFTGVLPQSYETPKGFCFDTECNESPIVDDPQSSEYNVGEKVTLFASTMMFYSLIYRTNHVIVTMGGDFQYQNSLEYFRSIDKLIALFKDATVNGRRLNVFYSTPTCYLYALNQANLTWPIKKDDFFPYASEAHSFWSGFYTSRPAIKLYERVGNSLFQSVKQLHAIAGLEKPSDYQIIDNFYRAMGVMQHHDAVTGTEKQHVANDYEKILSEAITSSLQLVRNAYDELMPKDAQLSSPSFFYCPLLNISDCSQITSNSSSTIAVTLYNPYTKSYSYEVRLPWDGSDYSIFNSNGEKVNGYMTTIPPIYRNLPERFSNTSFELVFAVNLTRLGFVTYFVDKKMDFSLNMRNSLPRKIQSKSTITAPGKGFMANFDGDSGDIQSITLDDGRTIKLNHQFKWYTSMTGNNTDVNSRSDGAYVFRPNGKAKSFDIHNKPDIISHPSVLEVRQTVSDYIQKVTRIRPDDEFVEIEFLVGPIPFDHNIGKDIVSIYKTDLNNNGTFYTDANGRQMMKRVRNYQPTYEYWNSEPVAGNYYPINSRILLNDLNQGLQLVILTDRSQGGSCLEDGSVEIMVHRRCLQDDGFGVAEALNETDSDYNGLRIIGKHYISVADIQKSTKLHRKKGLRLYMSPLITFAEIDNIQLYRNQYRTIWSYLKADLPENIHLLSLEMLNQTNWLVRLEYFYQNNEIFSQLSQTVKVDIRKLFPDKSLIAVSERTLTAVEELNKAKRLQWRGEDLNVDDDYDENSNNEDDDDNRILQDFVVTLKPMQIRTLIVTFE